MRAKIAVPWLLLALMLLGAATGSSAQIGISVSFGPPAIPVYDQPPCPEDGYIWTPGYWAWDADDDDYYWVPGTWVPAPEPGFLWTPPWWGWENGVYLFHEGYWGPHVGFYGGIYYGFGYFGEGFVGGRWEGGHFFYNRTVMNVVNVRNVYNETVINNNVRINRVSYNGGPGGIEARPRPQDEIAARDRHIGPVGGQTEQMRSARSNRELRASANNGRPAVAATDRAGDFRGHAVAAREAGGAYHPPANRGGGNRGGPPSGGGNAPSRPTHARDLPPLQRSAPPNTGNQKMDQHYQQQQDKLFAKQNQERQKLQQRQEQQDQRMAQRNAAQQQRQQTEQQHQRQTEQMQQRHDQQRQQLQQRQTSHGPPHR